MRVSTEEKQAIKNIVDNYYDIERNNLLKMDIPPQLSNVEDDILFKYCIEHNINHIWLDFYIVDNIKELY